MRHAFVPPSPLQVKQDVSRRPLPLSHTLLPLSLFSDALWEHSNQLRIDLQDVVDFDADLGSALEASPAEFLPLVRREEG